jgi:hypothetical protein
MMKATLKLARKACLPRLGEGFSATTGQAELGKSAFDASHADRKLAVRKFGGDRLGAARGVAQSAHHDLGDHGHRTPPRLSWTGGARQETSDAPLAELAELLEVGRAGAVKLGEHVIERPAAGFPGDQHGQIEGRAIVGPDRQGAARPTDESIPAWCVLLGSALAQLDSFVRKIMAVSGL